MIRKHSVVYEDDKFTTVGMKIGNETTKWYVAIGEDATNLKYVWSELGEFGRYEAKLLADLLNKDLLNTVLARVIDEEWCGKEYKVKKHLD